jgi:ACS family allantoate permease-like MFS transporter
MPDEKIPSYPDVEMEATRTGSDENEKEGYRRGSGAPEKVLQHANDADEAMKAFEGHDGEAIVIDYATNKRLLRKIDLNIMPVC